MSAQPKKNRRAKKMSSRTYRARVTKAYDGDTITCDVLLGFGVVLQGQRFRLSGINSPEVRGTSREAGLAARQYLKKLLIQDTAFDDADVDRGFAGAVCAGLYVDLHTEGDKKGKYGRWLAKISTDSDADVNALMIAGGHAVEYK